MRKVLSFVLVLSLVLGSFSMAFAATPAAGLSDIADNANKEAIQVAYDLGIVTGNPDGTFLPGKDVTRAEFAAMITRALAIPDSALAGYTASTFKDTAGYGWAVPYLAFCNSKGIMLGDGAGNAMPGRTIDVNEAITMALRAIGYTNNSAQLTGSWPSNYVTKAQDLGLYSSVAATTKVNKANAAQIIYNVLDENKVTVNADGDTTVLTGTTLLSAGLECVGTDEVVVYGDDSLINLSPYVGAYAKVYRNDDGDGDIVAVKPISTFLTGKFTGNYAEFKVGDVKYSYAKVIDSTIAGIRNAEVLTDAAAATTAQALTATNTSVTLAVKLSGKTITNVYALTKNVVTDDFVATKDVQDEITDDQELNSNVFALDANNEIDLNKFGLVGVASLDKIAKDHIVYVYVGPDSGKITKVTVGTEKVSARVTAYNSVDDEYTVGGKVYSIAAPSSLTTLTVGTEYDLYLDGAGDIYKATATSKDANNYAVLVDSDSGFNGDQVKLYLASDTKKVFSVDDDVTMPTVPTGTAVAYGLDKDGVINALTEGTIGDATMTGIRTLQVSGAAATATTNYAIAADCKVYTLNASGALDISSVGKVTLNTSLTPATKAFSFILNDDDEVVVMVVNASAAARDADDVYAVINLVTSVYDEANEVTVNQLAGLADGVAFTKMVVDDVIGDGTSAIGLIKVTYDADGYIKTATNAGITSTAALTFSTLNVAGNSVGTATDWYDTTDNVIVYEKVYNTTTKVFDTYKVSTLSKIKAGDKVKLYDTDTTSGNEGYEVVIFAKSPYAL